VTTVDPLGRTDYLFKETVETRHHRRDCQFGSGFYRIIYKDGGVIHTRHFESKERAELFWDLLPDSVRVRKQRDACLDGTERSSDASTPDVVDGEAFLAMEREEGMAALGLTSEADYQRAYNAVQDAVYARDNRESQGGVHAPVVVKRKDATREHITDIPSAHDNPGLR